MCTHDHKPHREGDCLEHGEKHTEAHRNWSRRQFLQGLGLAAAGSSFGFGASTVKAYSASPLLQALARSGTDRILVLVQLSGGNDGLNTIVPYSDPEYYRIRPTIAISETDILPISNDVGFHPRLSSFDTMYKDGLMQVLQGVGYSEPTLSHFASTDVWMTGGTPSDFGTTGWLGRYLDHAHPEFLSETPAYPLALQLGNGAPLLFQGPVSRMGIAFPNLGLLKQFALNGSLFDEAFAPENEFGSELSFVRSVANHSFQFGDAIQAASDTGSNLVEYPSTTGLSGNLAITARLIRGRLGSHIYHLNLGGFDTHSNQLTRHESLMQQLSDALGAFMSDLKADGWDKEVLVMTFSEFGRRIYQNGSGGTDHGTSAPLFMFGGGVLGGLIGARPSLTQLEPGGNMSHSIDFRGLYGSVLKDWFGLSETEVQSLINGSYDPVQVINASYATQVETASVPLPLTYLSNYPNPFQGQTTIELGLDSVQPVRIDVFDITGKMVNTLQNKTLAEGRHQLQFDAGALPSGTYFVRVSTSAGQRTLKVSLVR